MKRILSSIVLAAIAVTAVCEEHKALLRQLDEYLEKQGYLITHYQSPMGGYVEDNRYFMMHESWKSSTGNASYDSLSTLKRRNLQNALDSIRHTFAQLSSEASESCMYEYHKNSIDTIKYTIAFKREEKDDYTIRKGNGLSLIVDLTREAAQFRYDAYRVNEAKLTNEDGAYTHITFTPTEVSYKDMKGFDIEAYEEYLKPLTEKMMKLKGVKCFPVYWQHETSTPKEDNDFISKAWSTDSISKGLTTGRHYYMPSMDEEEKKKLYKELDSMTYEYVNMHPEQNYTYYFKSKPNLNDNIVIGQWENRSCLYHVKCYQDNNGFHILMVKTVGDFWIPSDWQRLKSYINGKKTYLKGM